MGSKTEKRQLKIFIGIAYGIPYLLGLLMWYGSMKQMDLSAFPVTQMLYPAMGVMFAFLLTRREDKEMPRAFYICFILMTALSIVCTALSVLLPDVVITTDYGSVSVFCMAVQYILAEHYLPDLFDCGREKETGGLWRQGKELDGVCRVCCSVCGIVFFSSGGL